MTHTDCWLGNVTVMNLMTVETVVTKGDFGE